MPGMVLCTLMCNINRKGRNICFKKADCSHSEKNVSFGRVCDGLPL